MLHNVGLETFVTTVDVVVVSVARCSLGPPAPYVIVSDELFSDRPVLTLDGTITFLPLALVTARTTAGAKMWRTLATISRGYSVFTTVIES